MRPSHGLFPILSAWVLLPWLMLASAAATAEALPYVYVDYQAAQKALAHTLTQGKSARLVTTLETRPLIALGIVFERRRAALAAKRRLRRKGIAAFVRRYRHGGWIVHAGAHADPRLSARRLAHLESLGYRRIVTFRVMRRVPLHRLVIDPPPPLPAEALPSRPLEPPPWDAATHLELEGQWRRQGDRWQAGQRLRLGLGAEGRRPGWEWRLGLDADGWREDGPDSGEGRWRVSPRPSFVRHRGNDGEWTLGWQNLGDGLGRIPVYDRIHRLDLSRPLDEQRLRPQPAVSWRHDTTAGRLRLTWSPWFRPALDYPSTGPWTPIDVASGRLLERRLDATLREIVRRGTIDNRPTLHGGFSLRLERRSGRVRRIFAVDYARPSLPYYRVDDRLAGLLADGLDLDTALTVTGGPALRPDHPPGWSLGYHEGGRRWFIESALWSDVPYTTPDYRGGLTSALRWAVGYTAIPRGADRIDLTLEGRRLTTDAPLLDRRGTTRIKLTLQRRLSPLAEARSRLWFGLDRAELILSTHLQLRLSRSQHLTLSARAFAGQEDTLGGFYRPRTHLALHWQYRNRP